MTDEELKALDAWVANGTEYVNVEGGVWPSTAWTHAAEQHVEALVAEVRRLRGVIKQAELKGRFSCCASCNNCPWCGYEAGDFKRKHAPECPPSLRTERRDDARPQ